MTARVEQRVRHRRRVTGRRAVIAGTTALGLTGAAALTTTLLSSAGAATTWPTARGSKAVSSKITVSGTYDGKLRKFFGSGALGDGSQEEGQDPIFELKDGAVLKNVIIGTPGADGVHCTGSCTLQNVWWLDVGEDAASFQGKKSTAVYKVIGGGARSASDKVFQFNGAGRLSITGFRVENFGKLVPLLRQLQDAVQAHDRDQRHRRDRTGQGAGRRERELRRHGDAEQDPYPRRPQEEDQAVCALQGQQRRQGTDRNRQRCARNHLQVLAI